MDYTAMEQYWIWLSSIDGIGIKRMYQLLTSYGDARSVWDALDGAAMPDGMRFLGPTAFKKLRDARDSHYFYALFDKLDRLNMRAVTRISKDYPKTLNEIYEPPATLFVRGRADLSAPRMIAIVGSRSCTRDGRRAAQEISEVLARSGVTIVSGMARGIDTHAHEGALAAGGTTIAVLGCGADVVYPPENDLLMERILDQDGAVISEFTPGTLPLPGNFPRRNRIISALCQGTLLVEGAKDSGAMITVNDALEQGRDVFAVPGSIYAPLSEMPNRMIADGAMPVLSPWDILEYYHWDHRPQAPVSHASSAVKLDPDEEILVSALRLEELSFDELTVLSGFSAAKLNSHLTMLELRGIIVKAPGGLYRAVN